MSIAGASTQSNVLNRWAQQSHPPLATETSRQAAPARIQQSVSFAYIGNTKMTVIGPVSGYQYSFDRPGARLYVDPRDRAGLASIRQLRQVR